MNKTLETKQRHREEVNNFEGLFFAFSNEQLKEGLKKVGLKEKDTNKIYSLGAGGYIRKDRSKAFSDMFKRQAKELKELREKDKTIKIKFAGVDGWNRACFVSVKKPKRFYGSVTTLFSSDATLQEVMKELSEDDLCYFGDRFGCEPMGSLAGNLEIVK